MNSGVYKITDTATGDYYIGSSKNLRVRKTQHYSDMRCERHANSHVQSIYNQGRNLSFEVYIYTRPEDRIVFEQRCLDILKPVLNQTLDALAPMDGKTHSPEYVEKLRELAFSPDSPFKRPEVVASRSGDNHYMRQPDYDSSKHPSKNPEITAKRAKSISKTMLSDGFQHPCKRPEVRQKLKEAAKKIDRSGEKHPQAKLTLQQVLEIIKSNKSYNTLVEEYGISLSQIARIKTGKSWKNAHKILGHTTEGSI